MSSEKRPQSSAIDSKPRPTAVCSSILRFAAFAEPMIDSIFCQKHTHLGDLSHEAFALALKERARRAVWHYGGSGDCARYLHVTRFLGE